MIGRRGFIAGLVSLVAAPAIVRVSSIMPVKVVIDPIYGVGPMVSAQQFIVAMAEAQRRLQECVEWRAPFLVDAATYREFITSAR